jgi:capsular polysaccharide biosynthesis protein
MSISDVYRTLWRQRLFVLVLTCLVVGAAYVLTSRQTKLYTASSLVRVQQQVRTSEEAFGALLTGERLARTYERIAETDAVGDIVAERLRGRVPSDAIAIDAAQLSNLELLSISVTNADPVVAARVANAVPPALASFIQKTGSFRDTITVVERASPPATPTSPNPKLNLTLAFLFGLILAAGLAILRDSLSDRIESVEDLEKIAGHPVIAVIPNLKFQPAVSVSRARAERAIDGIPAAGGNVTVIEPAQGDERASRWRARG